MFHIPAHKQTNPAALPAQRAYPLTDAAADERAAKRAAEKTRRAARISKAEIRMRNLMAYGAAR